MTTDTASTERSAYVKNLFKRIASHYDLMNRLMTAGFDLPLRRHAIRLAGMYGCQHVLDLGAGTGDITRIALKKYPNLNLTAVDFTLEMLLAGKYWLNGNRCNGDALALPFADCSFDVVISAYLMRNVASIDAALEEQFRVLKPGGRITILDTTRPRPNIIAPLRNFYLRHVIPVLGTFLTGDREAYTYLPSSTEGFVTAETLAEKMQQAGFDSASFVIRLFGTMALHYARKSEHPDILSSFEQ